jgi:hypothetical protein
MKQEERFYVTKFFIFSKGAFSKFLIKLLDIEAALEERKFKVNFVKYSEEKVRKINKSPVIEPNTAIWV